MRSVLYVMFAAAAVVACAESPKHAQGPAGAGSGSDDGMVCHEVTDTGSMFSHTECKPREDSQNERDDAQRFLKRPRSEPSAGH